MIDLSRKLNLALAVLLAAFVCRTASSLAAPPGRYSQPSIAATPSARPVFDAPGNSYAPAKTQSSFAATAPNASRAPVRRGDLTAEQAFAQVLGDLEELGQTDPVALQHLLRQLRSAKPAHYPLVVQQFKAAYAYSRELRERSRTAAVSPVEALPTDATEPAAPLGEITQPRLLPKPDAQLGDQPLPQYPSTKLISAEAEIAPLLVMSELRTIDPRYTAPIEPFAEARSSMPAQPRSVADAANENEVTAAGAMSVPIPLAANIAEETWEQSLSRAIDGLTLATREQGELSAELQVRLRLLELVAGRFQATSAPTDGLSAGEREYWSNQLTALATLLDQQEYPDAQRRAAAASAALAEAEIQLREQCPLTVRNLVLCAQVYGYGAFEPLANTTVKAGQRLTVYAEVENYRSVPTPKGFHTALATSYEILDAMGNRVDGNEFPTIDDYCLRRRRDFYAQYRVTLPAGLDPGKYQLQLTFQDRHADKLSHATVEFQIE